MTTISKTELKWILDMVIERRESSKEPAISPGPNCDEWRKLRHAKMSGLAEKLEKIIHSDCKRIATGW